MDILFEDHALVAVAKPAGLHVFPQSRGERQSVWSLLKEMRPELDGIGDPSEPAIVHRLDRGTSGVLLAAKDGRVYGKLRKAFGRGEIEKGYLALVEGILSEPVEVDLPLGSRHRRSKKVQVQLPGKRLRGIQPARTLVNPLDSSADLTLCRVMIQTGVRHQIRAHLSHLGHPVVGDRDYGASREVPRLGDGTCLHAWWIRVHPPLVGSLLQIVCPLPDLLTQILKENGIVLPAGP